MRTTVVSSPAGSRPAEAGSRRAGRAVVVAPGGAVADDAVVDGWEGAARSSGRPAGGEPVDEHAQADTEERMAADTTATIRRRTIAVSYSAAVTAVQPATTAVQRPTAHGRVAHLVALDDVLVVDLLVENAGQPRIRVYDFRHAAATMMIKARIPLAEDARRLGHSVETLVST